MSDWNMLVWITQLGLNVVLPLAVMTGITIWARNTYQLGNWIILCGIFIGFILAVSGFKNTLKEMEYMERRRKKIRHKKK